MARKIEAKTMVKIKRTKQGIILKADNGFEWKIKRLPPDIAIATVLAITLSKARLYEDIYSKDYIIEMKIQHKENE